MTEDRWRLAVDVGGTFIDYILLDESTGQVVVEKQPATAATLVEEFMTGLRRLDVPLAEIGMLIHGTTVALNTLVQLKGAATGLITTRGFRDVLELGRGGRPQLYNFRYAPARPLVERYLRREIGERLAADGTVLHPVDLDEVREQVDFLVANGVEAVAVTLLHSYTNPAHEQQVAAFIRAEYPQLAVSVSSELVREWREFERTSTTVINAFTQPHFSRYATSIATATREEGLRNPIAFVRSNGGVMPIDAAADRPVATLGSGPAGGVVGAHTLLAQAGYQNAICADVGGTTYDVALIQDGEIVERFDTVVEGRPIMGSVIDIVSVGAGGGSIASIDPVTGSLKVGPESAGAHPGPACFGIGGTRPTVTDAQVVLGLLDPERFLGQRMTLQPELSARAVKEHLGADRDPVDSAAGILAVAQSNMANAIRQITTQRGLDPREFVMLSYGGGGGLFAAGVSEELGVTTVVVPPAAAGFSAWGMLTADYHEDATVTSVMDLTEDNLPRVVATLGALETEARDALAGYGFDPGRLQISYSVEMRYLGQEHTLGTPVTAEQLAGGGHGLLESLPADFAGRHRARYGHGDADAPVQVVTLRCRAVAPVAKPRSAADHAPVPAEPVSHRAIWFPRGGWHKSTPVYERGALAATDRISGPAVVDEWTTTVVVPPGWAFQADGLGNLIMTFAEEDDA